MIARSLMFLVFLSLLVAIYLGAQRFLALEELIATERTLRAWLDEHPWLGVSAGFGIYVLASIVPGLTGKAVVMGWLFGFWAGLVMVNLGLTVAALASFSVSRFLARDFVSARFGPRLKRLDDALEREGASYLFTWRVLHAPFTVTNYVLGATRVRFISFWWATQLGILPGNILYAYAGAQAPTLEMLSREGVSALLTPGLLLAFLAVSILPFAARSAVRRLRAKRRGARPQEASDAHAR